MESVYAKAMAHELRKAGLRVECEKRITVKYDGVVIGEFSADKLVEEKVMVEEKAVQSLVPAHEVQLVNYLTATGIEIGLLLNFGAQRLEYKRKSRTYREKQPAKDFILSILLILSIHILPFPLPVHSFQWNIQRAEGRLTPGYECR